MATHSSTLAWKILWTEEPGGLQSMGSLNLTWLSDFTFTFHLHALEKEMATHSSVLAWRIPGTAEPGRLLSRGSHRVGHDWCDLAAAAASIHCLPWAQHQAKCFTCNMFVHNSRLLGKYNYSILCLGKFMFQTGKISCSSHTASFSCKQSPGKWLPGAGVK